MKTVIVIAAALLLIVTSSLVFACTTDCKLAASYIEKDNCITSNKLVTAIEDFEVDPFTILIPGYHF